MVWAGFRDVETPRTDKSGKLLTFLGLKEAGKGWVVLGPEGTGIMVEGFLSRSRNHSAEAGRERGRNTPTSPSTPCPLVYSQCLHWAKPPAIRAPVS